MKTRLQSLKSLVKKADKLYQIKLIGEKPYSVVSGKPTQVIHHFIPKGRSANLRYDDKNGVPLTSAEHFNYHKTGDPTMAVACIQKYGLAWFDDLQERRHIIRKTNKGYLKEVIESLVS